MVKCKRLKFWVSGKRVIEVYIDKQSLFVIEGLLVPTAAANFKITCFEKNVWDALNYTSLSNITLMTDKGMNGPVKKRIVINLWTKINLG
jgi:hypothetical protein